MRITVIIRDMSPLEFEEPIKHRSVRIQLTEDQAALISLRKTEDVSMCMLEGV